MILFTTSIFLPPVAKASMPSFEVNKLETRLNRPMRLPTNLLCGGLDDIKDGEKFILRVNGLFEKHDILMEGFTKGTHKTFFRVCEPELPYVYRFLQWRIKSQHLMSSHKGTRLQLLNFSAIELRRLIRHAIVNGESSLVNYR